MASTATTARRLRAPRRMPAAWLVVGAGCVVLAALSLLVARQTTYDPTAWLIWGREIVHGDLSTTGGPSWKPLPMLVTVPGALLGDAAQQAILLVAARAAVLAAVALAYRLAWRFGGPLAGVIAGASLLLAGGFAGRVFRGTSEGLLAALGLGAVEAHLAGRRWLAFWLLIAAALVRPELLLFAGVYGAWLAAAAPRPAPRRVVAAAAAVVLVAAAWVIPEKIGSGHWLRAASRALEPVAGTPGAAARPFVATFTNAAGVLPWPLYVAGVVFVVLALRDLRRGGALAPVLGIAAFATADMVVVAAMAERGFTGTTRYLTIPIALTGVLAGAGCARLVLLARTRFGPVATAVAVVVAVAVAAPAVAAWAGTARDEMRGALRESRVYADLPGAIARAGGRTALRGCGAVAADPFDTQVVARELRVHESGVVLEPRVPGAIVTHRGSPLLRDPGFAVVARYGTWVVASSCR